MIEIMRFDGKYFTFPVHRDVRTRTFTPDFIRSIAGVPKDYEVFRELPRGKPGSRIAVTGPVVAGFTDYFFVKPPNRPDL